MAQTDSDHSSEEENSLGLLAQLFSFNSVFWIATCMEMFERLAYYGLRTVLPVYMVLAVEEGGPEFSHDQKGMIYMWWAFVQSFVPIVSGGYADRYGYKLTVGVSIAIKVAGYLVMAFAVDIAAAMTGGESLSVPGHFIVVWVFLVGALLLALGTAVFKPGLQGIIAVNMEKSAASTGWAVFYQLVNFGAFFGPFLAGWMRLLTWRWVFVSCAVVVSLNYLLLLTFAEPEKPSMATQDDHDSENNVVEFLLVMWRSFIGICEPRLMAFLVAFSGFWMMFYQLFDLLPNFIEDWVDSSMIFAAVLVPVFAEVGMTPPAEWGGQVPQEWMINLNAGMIMLFAFAFGFVTGKMRSMVAMMLGIFLSAVAIYGLGMSSNGWWVLAAIAFFSVGEMLASPTKLRYFSEIAPAGKKGLYLGYVNATVGIGWGIGSRIAGDLYQNGGDKVVLARRYLVEELGHDGAAVELLTKTEVMPALAKATGQTPDGVRMMLWDLYEPFFVWGHFAQIGVAAMIALLVFDQITRRDLEQEGVLLLALTVAVASWRYSPYWGLFFGGLIALHEALGRHWPAALKS